MPAEISVGGSLLARPDAVTRDYKTAFSLGPVAIGDNSQGHHTFPWRARLLPGNKVWISRANEAGTGWGEEALLFTFEGNEGFEVDIAFDQNGGTVVAVDRLNAALDGSEVWLYWFNPLEADYSFDLKSVGRCPRLLLDDIENTAESDIQLFYLNDTTGRCEFRVQREFYDTPYEVPTDAWYDLESRTSSPQDSTAGLYLEEVLRTKDHRVCVVASQRTEITGRYRLLVAESQPYPLVPSASLDLAALIELLDTIQTILPADWQIASLAPIAELGLIEAIDLVITVSPEALDNTWIGGVAPSGLVPVAMMDLVAAIDLVITLERPDQARLAPLAALSSFDVILYVIVAPMQAGLANLPPVANLNSLSTVAA